MDGYVAKLDEICQLAEQYNALVMVDDSHATGFFGKTGRGSIEHCNVLKKIDQSFPNEVLLVLDATTGQNALNQVEEFSKIHNLTGLIITKLDSTAKGGVVLAICKKYDLPIVAIGMGEKEEDLQPFNAEYFSKALLGVEA